MWLSRPPASTISEMETDTEEDGGEAQQGQPAEADAQEDEREGEVGEAAEQRPAPAGMVQGRQEDEAEREAEERHLEGSQADDREGGAADDLEPLNSGVIGVAAAEEFRRRRAQPGDRRARSGDRGGSAPAVRGDVAHRRGGSEV